MMISINFTLLFRLSIMLSSFVAVNTSPLPPDEGSVLVVRTVTPLSTPLHLEILHRGTKDEHWSLIISEFFVEGVSEHENAPLKGYSDKYLPPSVPSDIVDLKTTAKFASKADLQKEREKLESLSLKVPPKDKGGISIDFVELILETLKRDVKIQAIPTVFTALKQKEYDVVYEKTKSADTTHK